MRSLKKALSLVLVLALMLSVCIFSASAADYTDAADIQYTEAVEVLTAIDVIGGMGDGTFNPTGNLTRAQAAKILCYLILGADTSKLNSSGSSFTDVLGTNDEWSAPYVEYCVNDGIVGGYGNGCFGPSDPLTGFAFAKMLLCALGYDADIEGYGGASWSVAVAKGIIDAELDDGLPGGFNYNGAITREEACQMALNCLKATMVDYDTKGTTIVTGDGTTVVTGASKAEPRLAKSATDGNIKKDGYLQFAEQYFQDLKLTDKAKADDFGRPANTWKLKTNEIGTYVETEDLVATYDGKVTKGTLYTLIGKSDVNDLKDGSNGSLTVYVDGLEYTWLEAKDVFDNGNSSTFQSIWKDGGHMADFIDATGVGSYTEVYQSDDNDVTIVVINEFVLQADSDYNTNKEELKVTLESGSDFTGNSMKLADNALEPDDVPGIETVEQDDYLIATLAFDSQNGNVYSFEVQSVKPATMVEGTVDFINKNVNKVEFGSVTIDGTTYMYGLMANEDDGYAADYGVGETAIVVTNDEGFILYVDDAKAVDKYVFVYDFGSEGTGMSRVSSDKADAFFIDGTDAIITVDEVKDVNGNKISKPVDKWGNGGWFSYSTGSDGKYDLREVPTTELNYYAGTNVLLNGKTAFISGKANLVGNKETTIIINDDAEDDTTLYVGASNAPDLDTITGTAEVFYTTKDNNGKTLKYVFVKCEGVVAIDDGSVAKNDYTYILWNDGTGTDPDNNNFVMVESLQNEGEWTMMNVKESDWDPYGGDCFQLVYKVKTNSDGYITGWTSFSDVANALDTSKQTKFEDLYFNTFSGKVGFSKGVLSFTDAAGNDVSLDVSNCDINLIMISADCEDLVDDPGVPADFTNLHVAGNVVKNTLSGYNVVGTIAGIRADDYSDTMTTVYITIYSASDLPVANS